MTDEPQEEVESWAYIHAVSSFEDDETALEALVQLKEIDLDNWFSERETNLETDEQEGISISFRTDSPYTNLHLLTDEDSSLHINLTLEETEFDGFSEIINEILTIIGELDYENCMAQKTINESFESLDVPIDHDSELEITGVRIRHDGGDFIIQEQSEGGINVALQLERDEHHEEGVPSDFVLQDIQRIDTLLEEVI